MEQGKGTKDGTQNDAALSQQEDNENEGRANTETDNERGPRTQTAEDTTDKISVASMGLESINSDRANTHSNNSMSRKINPQAQLTKPKNHSTSGSVEKRTPSKSDEGNSNISDACGEIARVPSQDDFESSQCSPSNRAAKVPLSSSDHSSDFDSFPPATRASLILNTTTSMQQHQRPAGPSSPSMDAVQTSDDDFISPPHLFPPNDRDTASMLQEPPSETKSAVTSRPRDDSVVVDPGISSSPSEPIGTNYRRRPSRLNSSEKQRLRALDDGSQRPGAYSMGTRASGSIPSFARTSLTTGGADDANTRFRVENEAIPGDERARDSVIGAVIDDDEFHENLRQSVLDETAQAQVVALDEEIDSKMKRRLLYWALIVITVLGIVIGISIGLTRTKGSASSEFPSSIPSMAPSHNQLPTLDIIKSNDILRCGVTWKAIFRLERDMCRALAAAVFGDPDKIVIVNITSEEGWTALENRDLDVITLASHTMDQDVYQGNARSGFTFSTPYLYDAQTFWGVPGYVNCTDRLDTYFDICKGVRLCVAEGTAFHQFLLDHVDDFHIQATPYDAPMKTLIEKNCNVYAGSLITYEYLIGGIRENVNTSNYLFGERKFLHHPYSMVTRQDDSEWSDFVTWVVRALIAAEEQNINNTTASKFMTTTLFGEEYKDMFANAIKAVGNYGDLYQRHIETWVSRNLYKYNFLNNGSTGLHYTFPIGESIDESSDPIESSTIYSITQQEEELRCGIFERAGFGEVVIIDNTTMEKTWQGMDADYCYALCACLFDGNTSTVRFVNLTSVEDGYQALNTGRVDVVAGGRLTLEDDVREETTGIGYTFSVPYYYGADNTTTSRNIIPREPMGAIALVTRGDDPQWSDFVFWVVMGTFIAEEQSITKGSYEDMGNVFSFGPSFHDMHRNAISSVGNYGEIYRRSVESIVPRKGRNLLNTDPFGPQLHSFF